MVPPGEYYWSSRGGSPRTNSFSHYTAPSDFSAGPTWVWQNEFKEQVQFSPMIDADFNIYVSTHTRLRKFDSDGHLLWTWHTAFPQVIGTSPALYDGHVYVLLSLRKRPTAVSIDMKTGSVHWQRTYDGITHGGDASAILVQNNTIWFGAKSPIIGDGTDTVVAASASDGSVRWQYVTDEVMWNFSPSTPGDGSLLFSSTCGAVFRLSFEGALLWRAGTRHHRHQQCVPGGGALGPNGLFYVEYNDR